MGWDANVLVRLCMGLASAIVCIGSVEEGSARHAGSQYALSRGDGGEDCRGLGDERRYVNLAHRTEDIQAGRGLCG